MNYTVDFCGERVCSSLDEAYAAVAELKGLMPPGYVVRSISMYQAADDQRHVEVTAAPAPREVEHTKAEETPTETPAAPERKETTVSATLADKPASLEDLRAEVKRLVDAGKRDSTLEVVKRYAPSVAEVPEGDRAELINLLKGMQ